MHVSLPDPAYMMHNPQYYQQRGLRESGSCFFCKKNIFLLYTIKASLVFPLSSTGAVRGARLSNEIQIYSDAPMTRIFPENTGNVGMKAIECLPAFF
jgi:hypothetical protein